MRHGRDACRHAAGAPSHRAIPGLQDYEGICKLWALRALVELGGYRAVIQDDHVSEPQLLRDLEVDLPQAFESLNGESIVIKLRERLRRATQGNTFLPSIGVLVENLGWLKRQLGLLSIEVEILRFCVLERHIFFLGQALETLNGHSNARLYSTLATLLDASVESVSKALREDGLLAQSGLIRLDNGTIYSVRDKLELPNGLEERLVLPQANPFDVFAGNFDSAPPPTLKLSDFDYLNPGLVHLQEYVRHAISENRKGVNILIYGPPGTGKTQIARVLAEATGNIMFEVAVSTTNGRRSETTSRLASFSLSQRVLSRRGGALVLMDEAEDIVELMGGDFRPGTQQRHNRTASKGYVNQLLETNPVPAIWISNCIDHVDPAHLRRFDYHLRVAIPPERVRSRILANVTANLGLGPSWCSQMASNQHLSPAVVAKAAAVVSVIQKAGVATSPECLMQDVLSRSLQAQRISFSGRSSQPHALEYLPRATNASFSFERLADGLSRHPSAGLCLHGPPGTGKSAYARQLASALGKPLLMRRASDTISCYVGETERRIADMFDEASRDGAVLILDEADSFLASREKAHQRWELSSVNEMLTQMESFEGIFIATTNYIEIIDPAALRRFDYKVEFCYLSNLQACEFLKQTCRILNLVAPDNPQALFSCTRLTPGDFSTVIRGSRFAPILSFEELCDRLVCETQHRGVQSRQAIGFAM